jgi:hypothetical protein
MESTEQHIGPDADEEIPCFCALATFGTFLSLLVREETRFRPLLDCILRYAERDELEHRGFMYRGVLGMLAAQRVDYYGQREFSRALADDIIQQLTRVQPSYLPVFRDAVDVAFRKASEFTTSQF